MYRNIKTEDMKKIPIVLLCAVALLLMSNSSAKKKKATFTVYGICQMCETIIEGTLAETEGVIWADWELETKLLTVKYTPSVISLVEIKQKLASAGYDSDDVRATDEAYEALHACCKYERPEPKTTEK